MKLYTAKKESAAARKIAADDMLLTRDMPTAAGSKMLDGFMSLIEAEALCRAKAAGFELTHKATVGEFAFDLLGESSCFGAVTEGDVLAYAPAVLVKSGEVEASLTLDVNGAPRRAAAQSGLVSVKPTYGTVSRYGTVPVACSGESVGVIAPDAATCRALLAAVAGHDDKDGTSLPAADCQRTAAVTPVRRVALLSTMLDGADAAVQEKVNTLAARLTAAGVAVERVDAGVIATARVAWNILMCAELCNNVSRYDGVKYGYRAQSFSGIDELYTNSRTEAFGELLKTAILFGSEALSTENYKKVYDKALRVRRVVSEAFSTLFEGFDAVLLPAASRMAYQKSEVEKDPYLAFTENLYTAPASLTGLPAVVVGGAQLVGKAFSENALLALAEMLEKEGDGV